MAKVGVSDFHYAKLIKDDTTGVTYDVIKAVPGLTEVSIKAASDTATLFADNGPFESSTALGEITVDISLADIPLDVAADLLGHTINAGVMTCAANDTAPNVAIGFVGLKSNGKKRYAWMLKGTFGIPDDNYQTKADKINFQAQTISGKFVIRAYDKKWKLVADEDATDYLPTTGTNWFTPATIQATVG